MYKVVVTYKNGEVKELSFESVSDFDVLHDILNGHEFFEVRNFSTEYVLENLLPSDKTDLATEKVEFFDGDALIKTFTNVQNTYYRFHIDNDSKKLKEYVHFDLKE